MCVRERGRESGREGAEREKSAHMHTYNNYAVLVNICHFSSQTHTYTQFLLDHAQLVNVHHHDMKASMHVRERSIKYMYSFLPLNNAMC